MRAASRFTIMNRETRTSTLFPTIAALQNISERVCPHQSSSYDTCVAEGSSNCEDLPLGQILDLERSKTVGLDTTDT